MKTFLRYRIKYNNMKKALFTLTAIIALTFTGISQERTNTATTNGDAELLISKTSRSYSYTLPTEISEERVEKSAEYYTTYFAVSYDATSREAKIVMNEKHEKGEMIMGRFLSSCGVRFMKVDDKEITLDEFIKVYLK